MDHPMDLVHGPWTRPMDHPMVTPNFQKEIKSPLLYENLPEVEYEKHRLIFIAYVLKGFSRNNGLLEIEGARVSYVIRHPTPSKVMLRLIRKLNRLCAPPFKLQAIH